MDILYYPSRTLGGSGVRLPRLNRLLSRTEIADDAVTFDAREARSGLSA
jgi:hypothetical protein